MKYPAYLFVVLLSVGAVLAEGDDLQFTMEHYESLCLDMSEDEAAEVMGAPGISWEQYAENTGLSDVLPPETSVEEANMITIVWENPDGSYISATFMDGALVSKVWSGQSLGVTREDQ